MPRLPVLSLTCALALVVAGCDRQSAEPAQPQESAVTENAGAENAAGAEASLSGKLDRSFAGEAIPAVTLSDPSGATLATADLKGKPALVNLWATWCVPCIAEMPMLDALAAEMSDSVRVVTVSEDITGADAIEPFFAARDLANLPKWMDPKNDLAVAYGGGTGLPLTVLYDADGKEVWRITGGYDWTTPAARALVTEAS